MNILDNEIYNVIQENIPYIIDAYAKVYGEKHRALIEERVNKIIYVIYNDIDGIEDYIYFLEKCKKRELFISFLQKVGVDFSKNQIQSYAEETLDKDIHDMMYHYIGIYDEENLEVFLDSGIYAWRANDEDEDVIQEKIEFINFLRGENEVPITKDTFQDFCKTDEYKQILDKIEEYIKIYDGIVQEYKDYLQELAPYKKYIEEENKRKNDILNEKRNKIYMQIEETLPDDIRKYLDERYSSIDEKSRKFLGEKLGEKSYIEYFSEEDENKLNSTTTSQNDKDLINLFRASYFESIGIEVSYNKEIFQKQCKEYKKLIPTKDLIKEITMLKEVEYAEAKKEFICNSKDFIENIERFGNNPQNIEAIYSNVKDKKVCITGGNTAEGFAPILFFTIRKYDGGTLDHILLHEVGHAIESEDMLGKNDYRSGFEFGTGNDVPKNPYWKEKRKYERLNETIRDMLTMEASKILHEQGIYILEEKELIRDTKNANTHSICKDLLKTFLTKYREEIIGVLLYGDIDTLYSRIGEENFEELVDIVNRVENLYGLAPKLENKQNEDPTVVEYYEQLERLNKVYSNMERHQMKEESSNDLLQSAISATEEATRLGSIKDAVTSISYTFEQKFEEGKNKQESKEINN